MRPFGRLCAQHLAKHLGRLCIQLFAQLRSQLFLTITVLMLTAVLFSACGGPAPPEDPFHLAQAKDTLGRGNHWYRRGCPAEAIRYFQVGLEQARMADRVDLIVKALNALGAAHMADGNLNAAATVLEQALELSITDPAKPDLESVWGNLGLLAYKANRLEDAKEIWQGAINEALAKGLSPTVFHCNLARLAREAGRQEEFLTQAALALETSVNSKEEARADALNLSALAFIDQGNLQIADTYLKEALELDRLNENQTGLAQDLEILGELAIRSGRWQEAASNLDRAFYLFAALGDRQAQRRVLAALVKLSKETGFPKSIEPYQRVMKDPKLFDPINELCP